MPTGIQYFYPNNTFNFDAYCQDSLTPENWRFLNQDNNIIPFDPSFPLSESSFFGLSGISLGYDLIDEGIPSDTNTTYLILSGLSSDPNGSIYPRSLNIRWSDICVFQKLYSITCNISHLQASGISYTLGADIIFFSRGLKGNTIRYAYGGVAGIGTGDWTTDSINLIITPSGADLVDVDETPNISLITGIDLESSAPQNTPIKVSAIEYIISGENTNYNLFTPLFTKAEDGGSTPQIPTGDFLIAHNSGIYADSGYYTNNGLPDHHRSYLEFSNTSRGFYEPVSGLWYTASGKGYLDEGVKADQYQNYLSLPYATNHEITRIQWSGDQNLFASNLAVFFRIAARPWGDYEVKAIMDNKANTTSFTLATFVLSGDGQWIDQIRGQVGLNPFPPDASALDMTFRLQFSGIKNCTRLDLAHLDFFLSGTTNGVVGHFYPISSGFKIDSPSGVTSVSGWDILSQAGYVEDYVYFPYVFTKGGGEKFFVEWSGTTSLSYHPYSIIPKIRAKCSGLYKMQASVYWPTINSGTLVTTDLYTVSGIIQSFRNYSGLYFTQNLPDVFVGRSYPTRFKIEVTSSGGGWRRFDLSAIQLDFQRDRIFASPGGVDGFPLFIESTISSSGDIPLFISGDGFGTTSGYIPLFISGTNSIPASMNLYTINKIAESGQFPLNLFLANYYHWRSGIATTPLYLHHDITRTGQVPLRIYGNQGYNSGTMNLWMDGAGLILNNSGDNPLYLQTYPYGLLNIFMKGEYFTPYYDNMTLLMSGLDPFVHHLIPLSISGITGRSNGNMNLWIDGHGFIIPESGSLNLFTEVSPIGTVNLFLKVLDIPRSSGFVPLYLAVHDSGAVQSGLNLYLHQPYPSGYGSVNLVIPMPPAPSGFFGSSGGIGSTAIPLFIRAQLKQEYIPIFLSVEEPSRSSGFLNMHLWSFHDSGMFKTTELFIEGDYNPDHLNLYTHGFMFPQESESNLNLFMPQAIDDYSDEFNIYMHGSSGVEYKLGMPLSILVGQQLSNTPLFMYNSYVGDSVQLSLLGPDIWSNSGSMNLFLSRSTEGMHHNLPIFLRGPSGINDLVPLYLLANYSGINNYTQLYISGTADQISNMNLFSHGF